MSPSQPASQSLNFQNLPGLSQAFPKLQGEKTWADDVDVADGLHALWIYYTEKERERDRQEPAGISCASWSGFLSSLAVKGK